MLTNTTQHNTHTVDNTAAISQGFFVVRDNFRNNTDSQSRWRSHHHRHRRSLRIPASLFAWGRWKSPLPNPWGSSAAQSPFPPTNPSTLSIPLFSLPRKRTFSLSLSLSITILFLFLFYLFIYALFEFSE